jgi:Uma2 family endonuclease
MPFVTPEEYLEAERAADYKSEYVSGQIWAMSGASRVHNALATNLTASIATALRGTDCQTFGSDMRVYVAENRTYVYPDLSVVCGEQVYTDAHVDTLTNPTVIIEILSPSTAHYDRTVKFVKYRRLPSLREYVLVHQDAPYIEYFALVCDIWTSGACRGLESTLELESIGVTVNLADIYERVHFAPAENNP